MDGLFIDGRRPKSKKEVKEVAASDPSRIEVEVTSLFSSDPGGDLAGYIERKGSATFVGPDPYTKRSFYLTVKAGKAGKLVVS